MEILYFFQLKIVLLFYVAIFQHFTHIDSGCISEFVWIRGRLLCSNLNYNKMKSQHIKITFGTLLRVTILQGNLILKTLLSVIYSTCYVTHHTVVKMWWGNKRKVCKHTQTLSVTQADQKICWMSRGFHSASFMHSLTCIFCSSLFVMGVLTICYRNLSQKNIRITPVCIS